MLPSYVISVLYSGGEGAGGRGAIAEGYHSLIFRDEIFLPIGGFPPFSQPKVSYLRSIKSVEISKFVDGGGVCVKT